jgi:hypothetical protein
MGIVAGREDVMSRVGRNIPEGWAGKSGVSQSPVCLRPQESRGFVGGPIAQGIGFGGGEPGLRMEHSVLGRGHPFGACAGAGGGESGHGDGGGTSGAGGPLGEVHRLASRVDVGHDGPPGGCDLGVPGPLGVVGMAVGAGATERGGNRLGDGATASRDLSAAARGLVGRPTGRNWAASISTPMARPASFRFRDHVCLVITRC